MQQLPCAEWGHNPLFEPEPGFLNKIQVVDKEKETIVDLEFDLRSSKRITHYGLWGRATNSFPVKSEALFELANELAKEPPSLNGAEGSVTKIHRSKETHQGEIDILKKVYEIAAEHPEVNGHEDTCTAKIGEAFGIDVGGHTLYAMVSIKLRPITELSGDKFLRAWWHAVACRCFSPLRSLTPLTPRIGHRALWEEDVRHCDINPNNLVFYYDSSGEIVGVLNDYDLSLMNSVLSGKERIGTAPFMAVDLLSQAIRGKVEHVYRHDAESFIWVLIWICLRYSDGVLHDRRQLVELLLTKDTHICEWVKKNFRSNRCREAQPSLSHQSNWSIALSCLEATHCQPKPIVEVKDVFKTWFEDVVPLRIQSM